MGWFLLISFVDFLRVCFLHIISRNRSDTYLLINLPKTILQQGIFVLISSCHLRQVFLRYLNMKKWWISDKLSDDWIVNGIRKYENHSSISNIKSSVEITLFDFNFVNSDDISKIINLLDSTQRTSGAIPTKIVKLANKQICKDLADRLHQWMYKAKKISKRAKNNAYIQNEDPLDKTNYKHTTNCFKHFQKNTIQSITTFFQ